ncbi:hypothetical protein OPT61_g1526 [Boeremia exigua]|uniref:Uncharacterized protein n=1 Tax=Boeremia exigua TaxID=749465 RepID=A0ACC2IQ05_9PLEO|nr:hypothetical protein OPT61_g1526 [Boeremia exigua]
MTRFGFPPLASGPPSRRNWYKELLDDPACDGNATRVQEAYETHREGWREKQIELFVNSSANPVTPDQALIKHLSRQTRLASEQRLEPKDDTDAQEMNCCVIWARPPSAVLKTIQTIQEELRHLIGDNLYLIPLKDLHLSVIELSHRHTVSQLRSVAAELGESRIQDMLDLVSTLGVKPELVAPTISFDKMGIALNYLPSDTHAYTYHHLRSDMYALALESKITGIDCCYTAPSAHITIGRFIDNKFFETAEARTEFVERVKSFNAAQKEGDHAWVVGESQGLELQLGYLKFGRESSKADLVGKFYAFPLDGSWVTETNLSNAEISDRFTDEHNEGTGSAHIWGNPGGPVPWERDDSNLFTIHYCFMRDYDREYIRGTLEAAIREWWYWVGQAGPASGHGVVLKETVDQYGNPEYCMDGTQEDKWNKKVPYDTLPIQYTSEQQGSCSSTIGLQRTSPPTHWNMRLSIDAPHLFQDTMHVLGHVFGMAHEHQRIDRDKYIQVRYRNLRDHRSCFQKAQIKEPSITEDQLCLDYKRSAHYGCGCREYIKGVTSNGEEVKAASKDFDYESIMMYNTADNAKEACNSIDLEQCPLVRFKDPEHHNKGVMRIQNQRAAVSYMDYLWLRSTYPWKEPPK